MSPRLEDTVEYRLGIEWPRRSSWVNNLKLWKPDEAGRSQVEVLLEPDGSGRIVTAREA